VLDRTHIGIVALTGGLLFYGAFGSAGEKPKAPVEVTSKQTNDHVEVPPPPFTEGLFPCSSCHSSMQTDRTRRTLSGMHDDIVLKHDQEHRWCLDCHDARDRDNLHLASGELVSFETSYLLCGQCHGEKLRDWRAGVHGRRTGNWNGAKRYLLCAHCHDPHQPRFRAVKPMPAPARPVRTAK
jgi:hypothetical protein